MEEMIIQVIVFLKNGGAIVGVERPVNEAELQQLAKEVTQVLHPASTRPYVMASKDRLCVIPVDGIAHIEVKRLDGPLWPMPELAAS